MGAWRRADAVALRGRDLRVRRPHVCDTTYAADERDPTAEVEEKNEDDAMSADNRQALARAAQKSAFAPTQRQP